MVRFQLLHFHRLELLKLQRQQNRGELKALRFAISKQLLPPLQPY